MKNPNTKRDGMLCKIVIGLAIATILLLTYIELAVGLFGTPWAGS